MRNPSPLQNKTNLPPPEEEEEDCLQAIPADCGIPGVTRREFSGLKNKMDRVLETVSKYPAPATNEELNTRLTKIVQEVVDKQFTTALSKHTDRIVQIEEDSARTIHHRGQVMWLLLNK